MPNETPAARILRGREAVERILAESSNFAKAPEDSPERRRDTAAAEDAELDVRLKKLVARGALAVMTLQVLIADAVFVAWGIANEWHIETAAIISWLSATVVQVIGIVFVITQYLFPKRKRKR